MALASSALGSSRNQLVINMKAGVPLMASDWARVRLRPAWRLLSGLHVFELRHVKALRRASSSTVSLVIFPRG
jgi:hypothetical protein